MSTCCHLSPCYYISMGCACFAKLAQRAQGWCPSILTSKFSVLPDWHSKHPLPSHWQVQSPKLLSLQEDRTAHLKTSSLQEAALAATARSDVPWRSEMCQAPANIHLSWRYLCLSSSIHFYCFWLGWLEIWSPVIFNTGSLALLLEGQMRAWD